MEASPKNIHAIPDLNSDEYDITQDEGLYADDGGNEVEKLTHDFQSLIGKHSIQLIKDEVREKEDALAIVNQQRQLDRQAELIDKIDDIVTEAVGTGDDAEALRLITEIVDRYKKNAAEIVE